MSFENWLNKSSPLLSRRHLLCAQACYSSFSFWDTLKSFLFSELSGVTAEEKIFACESSVCCRVLVCYTCISILVCNGIAVVYMRVQLRTAGAAKLSSVSMGSPGGSSLFAFIQEGYRDVNFWFCLGFFGLMLKKVMFYLPPPTDAKSGSIVTLMLCKAAGAWNLVFFYNED